MTKYVIEFDAPSDEDDGSLSFEDSGQAAIMEPDGEEEGDDGCFFVRLRSWYESGPLDGPAPHPLFRSLMGRRVRVTVETVDEP